MKKKKDFVILIVLITAAYFVSNVLNHPDFPIPMPPPMFVMPVMVIILGTYNLFLYRVTSNYIRAPKFRFLYAVLLLAEIVLGGVAAAQGVAIEETRMMASVTYVLAFISMAIIFTVIVVDMFANTHDLTYSLLAATNAFLILPVAFSFVFAFISVFNPSLLGPNVSDLQTLVRKCFEVSHFIAAGMDPPDSAGSTLLRNVGVFEAFIVNLYIVFVVGKLMIDASARLTARGNGSEQYQSVGQRRQEM